MRLFPFSFVLTCFLFLLSICWSCFSVFSLVFLSRVSASAFTATTTIFTNSSSEILPNCFPLPQPTDGSGLLVSSCWFMEVAWLLTGVYRISVPKTGRLEAFLGWIAWSSKQHLLSVEKRLWLTLPKNSRCHHRNIMQVDKFVFWAGKRIWLDVLIRNYICMTKFRIIRRCIISKYFRIRSCAVNMWMLNRKMQQMLINIISSTFLLRGDNINLKQV